MNVFDLDSELVAKYEEFARSFTIIRADDEQPQDQQIVPLNPDKMKPPRGNGANS